MKFKILEIKILSIVVIKLNLYISMVEVCLGEEIFPFECNTNLYLILKEY